MTRLRRVETALLVPLLVAFAIGAAFCILAVFHDVAAFFRAWLLAYLFWLGLPLCGVTLVLVHDLTGGEWMETARPALDAAIATMPLATLAGIPAFIGLESLYGWTHPETGTRQCLLSQSGSLLPALRDLCRVVERHRRLCAAGTAR